MDVENWDTVKKWMHSKTVVPSDVTVQKVAELMVEKNIGSVIVSVSGREAGIITERDILKRVTAKGLNPASIKVEQIMSRSLITIHENASLEEAAELMSKHRIRRLPVVNQKGEIIGIVTTRTISYALPLTSEAKFRLEKMKHKE